MISSLLLLLPPHSVHQRITPSRYFVPSASDGRGRDLREAGEVGGRGRGRGVAGGDGGSSSADTSFVGGVGGDDTVRIDEGFSFVV